MKNIILILLVIVVVGFGLYFLIPSSPTKIDNPNTGQDANATTTPGQPQTNEPLAQPVVDQTKTIIGKSVEKRDIIAYHYGSGETEILFVGGIHGGYSWNTSLLAYKAMDYLEANPNVIPTNLKITIIPVLNPDGLNKVVGTSDRFSPTAVSSSQTTVVAGRFNANEVDLNRNFDCDWQATGIWQSKTVSGGSQVFSEPESQAIKNYVASHKLQAVIVWYSAAGGVYSSSCHNGILPTTKELTNLYAKAAGYTSNAEFDSYAITGDMVNWLAKEKIPAISVLLTTHNEIEWTKNQAGIDAVLKHYKK